MSGPAVTREQVTATLKGLGLLLGIVVGWGAVGMAFAWPIFVYANRDAWDVTPVVIIMGPGIFGLVLLLAHELGKKR